VPDPWADERGGQCQWFVPDVVSRDDVVLTLREQGERTRKAVAAHDLSDVGRPGPRWDGHRRRRCTAFSCTLFRSTPATSATSTLSALIDGQVGE